MPKSRVSADLVPARETLAGSLLAPATRLAQDDKGSLETIVASQRAARFAEMEQPLLDSIATLTLARQRLLSEIASKAATGMVSDMHARLESLSASLAVLTKRLKQTDPNEAGPDAAVVAAPVADSTAIQ